MNVDTSVCEALGRIAETAEARLGPLAEGIERALASGTLRVEGRRYTLAAAGSRGPVVAWALRDGEPDPDVGITITIDETLIPMDYEIAQYRYSLDGRFREKRMVGFDELNP